MARGLSLTFIYPCFDCGSCSVEAMAASPSSSRRSRQKRAFPSPPKANEWTWPQVVGEVGSEGGRSGRRVEAALGGSQKVDGRDIPWQLINISVFGKRHRREKERFFRESFATPSPRPFVCSVRSAAIVAAAVMLANKVAAVRSVKCKQSPHSPLPLALAGDVRNPLQQALQAGNQ